MSDALKLSYAYGFNRNLPVPVINLCDGNRRCIFYASGHTGVIFDYVSGHQLLLRGHKNAISCIASSLDRRYLVSVDSGADSMVIVWDSKTGAAVRMIENPHGKDRGVVAVDISHDAMVIATLSAATTAHAPQELSLWEWTADVDFPLAHSCRIPTRDKQSWLRFHPSDSSLLITNGSKRVIFWSVDDRSNELSFYSPPAATREFKQTVGRFTKSAYVPGTDRAVTATSDGDLVLWDRMERKAIKVVRVHNACVDCVEVIGRYIVTGASDGYVRFYDFDFHIMAWFEDLNAGAIQSLSFNAFQDTEPDLNPDDVFHMEFHAPDFIVCTSQALVIDVEAALFEEVDPEKRRGTLILQGHEASVTCLATHPELPVLAIGSASGALQLWNYGLRKLLLVSIFTNTHITSIAYDQADGKYLALGFASGAVKVLDANTLEDKASFHFSKSRIDKIVFATDGLVFATADAEHCVGIYRWGNRDEIPTKPIEWTYIGRYKTHKAAISGLVFARDHHLISVGRDRRLVEYDVDGSTMRDGIKLHTAQMLEQSLIPTSMLYDSVRDKIIFATDQGKFRVYNGSDMAMEKTARAPTIAGAAIGRLATVGVHGKREERYLAYACDASVIGLCMLPLDGNPFKTMGVIAHPSGIADFSGSADGQYLFSAGAQDGSVFQFQVQVQSLEEQEEENRGTSESKIEPYLSLVEGGRESTLFKDFTDYFYYAQIRVQGEATTSPRKIVGYIPYDQVPNVFRAVGFFPSERDIEDMLSELERDPDQRRPGWADFDTAFVLFLNHRPLQGISAQQISKAFRVAAGALRPDQPLARPMLIDVLKNRGEGMSIDELNQSLKALLGERAAVETLPNQLNVRDLAVDVLGFEDFNLEDIMAEEDDYVEGSVRDEDDAASIAYTEGSISGIA
eukprot:ANDGO_03811.mRNA.1 putative WD repeat-containing protein alr3466